MRRESGALELAANARPPSELARAMSLTAQGFIGAAGRFAGRRGRFGRGRRFAVQRRLARLGRRRRRRPRDARAAAAGLRRSCRRPATATWRCGSNGGRGELVGGTVDLALTDVALPTALGAAARAYERIALKGDWQRDGDSWHVALRDVGVTRAGRTWPERPRTRRSTSRATRRAALTRLALQSGFLRLEDLTPFVSPLPGLARARFVARACAARRPARRVARARATTPTRSTTRWPPQFTGLGVQPFEGLPGFDGAHGRAARGFARSGRVELRSDAAVARLAGLVPRRARARLRDRHRRVARRPRRSAGRERRSRASPRRTRARARTSSSRCRSTAARRSSISRPSISSFAIGPCRNISLRTRCRRPSSIGSTGAARRRRAREQRAFPGPGEVVSVRRRRGPVPRASRRRGRPARVHQRLAVGRGSRRHRRVRQRGLRGARQRPDCSATARPTFKSSIPDLRAADLALKLGYDRAARAGARCSCRPRPLIARHLGADFARLEAPNGTGEVSVDLAIPLRDRESYELTRRSASSTASSRSADSCRARRRSRVRSR